MFDACFFEDLAGVYDTFAGKFDAILGRGGQLNLLDPLMVLPYIARATTKLGLGITLSTSFYHPFHIARMLGITRSSQQRPHCLERGHVRLRHGGAEFRHEGHPRPQHAL